jgi:hypothetical protein
VREVVAIDRERTAQLLAAVGNHEGKALVYLSLEEDTEYGVAALHHRWVEIQGSPPVFKGVVNLPQKYVLYTFEPVGLCARTLAGDGPLRHIKHDPDGRATALAGTLLALTENQPITLGKIFGKTAKSVLGPDRAPIRRLELLRTLVELDAPVSQAELMRRSGIHNKGGVTNSLDALREARVITYSSRPTYEMKTSYRIWRPLVLPPRQKTFSRSIAAFLNQRWDTEGRAFSVSRDEIEDHLVTLEEWEGRYIRDVLQGTMERLASRGLVELEQNYLGQRSHSTVSLTPEQRTFAVELLMAVQEIQSGDAEALERGVEHGKAIVAEPARVRPLVDRCFSQLKVVVNPTTERERRQLVLHQLASGPATSQELLAALRPRLNKALLGATLSDLARDGHVAGVRMERSPQKVWSLVSADAGNP